MKYCVVYTNLEDDRLHDFYVDADSEDDAYDAFCETFYPKEYNVVEVIHVA